MIGCGTVWPDFLWSIEIVAWRARKLATRCVFVGMKKCVCLRRRPLQKIGLLYLEVRRGTQVAQGRGLQNPSLESVLNDINSLE
jgi:hypothetical protein